MHIRPFERRDTDAVVALWQARGLTRPWNDPLKDIERKLAVQPELFLVGERDGEVIATAMGGYDGHRGSVYYLAAAEEHAGKRLWRCAAGRTRTPPHGDGLPEDQPAGAR